MKNDAIKEFVSKSLLDKVGETRTVRKVLEVLAEKYSKTICEQIKDTMRKICSSKMSEKVDTLIDNFDEMLIEMTNLRLAEILQYAVSAQFVDRLEENGKINATEKLRLKDILEDQNGKPRNGDTTEQMRRELKRLKIVNHRDEPFANRDTTTHYVRDDDRSRYDNWRNKIQSEGFRRSESNPKFFRTASKGRYHRDNSKFGGRSNSRQYNSSRPYRDASRIRSQSRNRGRSPGTGTGNRDKSAEKPKSDLVKKVESIEKEISTIKQSVGGIKKIEEMLKKVTINTQFVEEEISIDIKYVQKEIDNSMIIDSGAPVSLMSSAWLANYIEEAKVDNEEIVKSSSNRRFRLGKTPYISTEKVTFPVVMKTDDNDFMKRNMTANLIQSDEVNFLCGEETLRDWRTVLDFEERKLGFKDPQFQKVDLIKKSHLVVKLELVGKWKEDEAVFAVKEKKRQRKRKKEKERERKRKKEKERGRKRKQE